MMSTQFIKPEEIESKLAVGKNTIIAVSATWCGPCNMMTEMVWNPINDEKGEIQIFKVDADEHKEWSRAEGVAGLPTMFVYNGTTKKKDPIVGFLPKEEFIKSIKG